MGVRLPSGHANGKKGQVESGRGGWEGITERKKFGDERKRSKFILEARSAPSVLFLYPRHC